MRYLQHSGQFVKRWERKSRQKKRTEGKLMPKVKQNYAVKNTPGGRLRKFWPKNGGGEYLQIQEWAKEIGLAHQTLGEVLRDVKNFRWGTYERIVAWMFRKGYTEKDAAFFLWGDIDSVLNKSEEEWESYKNVRPVKRETR